MRISRIKVENFRSIQNAEITPTNFNIFVGQNNHGKTNFFEAIDWFYGGKGDIEKIRYGRSGDAEVIVEVEFADILDGIEKMRNEKNRTTIRERFGAYETLKIRRTSGLPKVRQIFDQTKGEWLEKNPTGFDSAFNDFLPSFEYVNTDIRPMDMAKYGKGTPVANMLAGVLSVILSKDPTYTRFMDEFDRLFTDTGSQMRVELDRLSGQVKVYLEKQFPDCEKVVFEVAPPIFEDLLKKFETSIDDGVYTAADEKGDGMQRALMLAIIQAYADFRRDNEETNKYFLFLIDEGELHLHPSAQRKLKNALLDLSKGGDQVFLNTHSSVLVSDDTDGQTIFKVEKIEKATTIMAIQASEKPHVVYELLGGSPSDLLLPNNFLIVEGKSEYELISRVIARFYPEKKKIQIIYAGGDHDRQRETMDGINKVFVPLFASPVYKERLAIICDTPTAARNADFENFKRSYAYLETNDQLFVIPHRRLEEYYPQPWRKAEAEIQAMNQEKNAKMLLAREVGDAITQQQFEGEMNIVFDALTACWNKAY
jgi:putative ATP-dependent endonuclease of OLD family